MSRVWDESKQNGTALLLLLAIADHANDQGIAWPSISTLAAKARVKDRQAQNLIAQLESAGELVVKRGKGRRNTSIYVVTCGGKGAIQRDLDEAEKVQSSVEKVQSSVTPDAEKVQSSVEKGAIATTPDPLEPSINTEPSIEPSRLGADAPGVAGAPASVPSVVPLALQFRAVTDELRADGANRPAILRAWYVACFGEAGAPDYGRIGRVAKEIGGAGLLARRFLELAGCPPSGDVLSYIQAGAKRARVERNGGPAAAADWSVQAAQHPAPASPMAPMAQAAPAAIAGDPDLAAVLAADWADRVASVERAGEASPGVPLVRVVGRVAGDGWLKQKGSVAIRRLLTALVFGPGGVMVEVAA